VSLAFGFGLRDIVVHIEFPLAFFDLVLPVMIFSAHPRVVVTTHVSAANAKGHELLRSALSIDHHNGIVQSQK
jgi:L-ribulose-5-phosphate 3-epimerase UlaE